MESGDSGTESDGSNKLSTVGSIIGGAIGSLAGPAVKEKGAALSATVGKVITGTAK